MSHYSNVDRESFQNILASAFTLQQRLGDDEWRSTLVEVERLTRNLPNTIGVALDPFHDQTPLPGLEEDDQSYGTSAPTEESAPKGERAFSGSMETSEAPCCDDTDTATEASTPAPRNVLPTAADILDACFPSFRVCQPEVKPARLRPRGWWTPLQLILLVALVLLLGWMFARPWSRRIGYKKRPPPVIAEQDTVIGQPEKNRQADQRSQTSWLPKAQTPGDATRQLGSLRTRKSYL
jgi:hypothetical protein